MTDLHLLPARDVVGLLRKNEVSISELLTLLQQRISRVDSKVNALPTLCFERAHEHAGKLQSLPVADRGPLAGLPITIKDLTPVSGVRTTFGCKVFENFIPDVSDQLVTRLEQRGGVVYGKTNVPEFGAGGISFNAVFERTSSPHDVTQASGGSSGGAAASLASGCAWLSHGSDMAGSLRTPAAFCGVSSLRPSPGILRSDSEYLPFDVLGSDGPMARDLQDLALFADVMINDYSDAMQRAVAEPKKPLRVAVSADLGITSVSPAVVDNFRQAINKLSDNGVEIVEAHPDLQGVHEAFDALRANVFSVGLEALMQENPGVLKEELEWNVSSGLSLTSLQLRNALRQQGQIVKRAAEFMQSYDLLLCPATSVMSAPVGERYVGAAEGVPIEEYYRWLAIAYATTMTALPVVTLPIRLPGSSMPLGVQLVGQHWSERALFSHARFVEQCFDYDATPVEPG